MVLTNDYSSQLSNNSLSGHIVQLRPVVDEKTALPERLWQSLKSWKANLQYLEEECHYLQKMIKWNGIVATSIHDTELFAIFDKLANMDHPRLITEINYIEKEIVATLFDKDGETKSFLLKWQKLENKLKEFSEDLTPIKLQVLKKVANNLQVTFF